MHLKLHAGCLSHTPKNKMAQQKKKLLALHKGLKDPIVLTVRAFAACKRIKALNSPKPIIKAFKHPKNIPRQRMERQNLEIIHPELLKMITVFLTKEIMRRWGSHSFRRPQARSQQQQ